MFCTVLHSLKSPTNVGTIVRSHVAFGGSEVVFVGHDRPWSFKKGSQAFSRKLERQCKLVFLETDQSYFDWAAAHCYRSIAVEISEAAAPIQEFRFPGSSAIIVGNEATGLSAEFLASCEFAVRIPQPGPVGSLNVATAAAIAMHEVGRDTRDEHPISGNKYRAEHGS